MSKAAIPICVSISSSKDFPLCPSHVKVITCLYFIPLYLEVLVWVYVVVLGINSLFSPSQTVTRPLGKVKAFLINEDYQVQRNYDRTHMCVRACVRRRVFVVHGGRARVFIVHDGHIAYTHTYSLTHTSTRAYAHTHTHTHKNISQATTHTHVFSHTCTYAHVRTHRHSQPHRHTH